MKAHDWFIEHRTEFAARVLDAEELASFEEHLVRCEECRSAVARIEDDLAWLPMGAASATPRPGLERQIADHALGRAARRPMTWAVPLGLAATLLALVGGWQAGERQGRQMATDSMTAAIAASTERLNALEDTVSVMRQAAKVMQAKIEMHGQVGGLVIFADAKSHRWNVVLHGLPAAPADGRYQFWFICADGMVRGAELHVDPKQPMIFTTGLPSTGGPVIGAALTMEPMAATAGPPQGKELAHLML